MNYSHYIKQAISYIQQHLNKDLTLTIISDYIGYSSYHFHRLFKKETGLSLYDYIQQQRLIQASMLLKYTNLPILEIAYQSNFQSQESFTRAFKKIFQLPPKKYRTLNQIITRKGEIFMSQQSSNINGWFKSGSASEKYDMTIDNSVLHINPQSAKLFSIVDNFKEE